MFKILEKDLIQGMAGAPSISYINFQYTHDTLIFGKAEVMEALII